ncbi:hypothetical protein EJ05DRAFT_501595 [Pseudovirgaria hyperparasitica]|uniref:Uncharacterized protein n=1 Tax=Pseudovirgaria hyperparasitica TaxID=470096 RepID=A0A6A6W372_9PEZI|nr:uncharacterized protein EJ05DRAFT_501595 [Pseudovirgaria hyperparasitica]KAF2757053.1 hypothetical protein EJ05DRAFT_501595 [Pseudovirgaria hyperparasitica]
MLARSKGKARVDQGKLPIEFRKNLSLNKKDFGSIEYMLRKGHRQLEIYSDPGIRNVSH